jgi:dipeptidyl aminopeptidase/acylaminoacyl peptidase
LLEQAPTTEHRGLTPELRTTIERIAGVVGSWCPSISPDGRQIAYVTDRSGLPRLEVAHLDPAGACADRTPRQVSRPDQEVISVAWSPDGRWLTYLVSPEGSIRAQLHAIRPDGTDHRALAGMAGPETVFAGSWTSLPHTYAFSLADGRSPDADVCFVDVETGAVRRVATGGFLLVTGVSPDAGRLVARRGPRGHRHLVLADIPADADAPLPSPRRLLERDFPLEGTDVAEDGRFSADGSTVYLRVGAGREYPALGAVALDADGIPGRLRILAERTDADLDAYAVLDQDTRAMLVWNLSGHSAIELRDLRTGAGHRVDIGRRVLPGWSVLPDGRSGILELTEPVAPRSLYHVDLVDHPDDAPPAARRITGLPVPRLPAADLCVPERVSYRSTDGVRLRGLLYRTAGEPPFPTVILLHGGPEAEERPAFSILIQSLVAAGFVVFAPNVRGSTGYGASFTALDDLDRRESSFADVQATVEYLVDRGITAPGHVGVHGWSYGGYLAMISLTRFPELFASGSSHAGMSDLRTFFTYTEPWMAAASVTEYGDPVADASLLEELSPLVRFDRMRVPTFFVHGEHDTNVPVIESVQAARALADAGVPTELMLLPGEGHTIVGREGRIASTEGIVDWHLRWAAGR